MPMILRTIYMQAALLLLPLDEVPQVDVERATNNTCRENASCQTRILKQGAVMRHRLMPKKQLIRFGKIVMAGLLSVLLSALFPFAKPSTIVAFDREASGIGVVVPVL